MDSQNFTHHFLIAMPAMMDPNFSGSVTYLCEHNAQGAIGIVVNRPSDLTVVELLSQIDIPCQHVPHGDTAIMVGGPVQQNRGFVLHSPPGTWTSSLPVAEEVAMTTSKDILEAIARGDGPDDVLISMGYAGWGAGQLEEEIAANAWLTVKADPRIIFATPVEKRFDEAMKLLGISASQLTLSAGHA